jgi:hypothetical protein
MSGGKEARLSRAGLLVLDDDVLQFGCAMVMTFLLFWAIESLRGWRATNDKTPTNERKG